MFAICPRPYCKNKIEIQSHLSMKNDKTITNSEMPLFTCNCINKVKIENIQDSARNQYVISFEKTGTNIADNLIVAILSFVATLCIIGVGVTCDTILLAILVVFYTLRNISVSWQPRKVIRNHRISDIKLPTDSRIIERKMLYFKHCLYSVWKISKDVVSKNK